VTAALTCPIGCEKSEKMECSVGLFELHYSKMVTIPRTREQIFILLDCTLRMKGKAW